MNHSQNKSHNGRFLLSASLGVALIGGTGWWIIGSSEQSVAPSDSAIQSPAVLAWQPQTNFGRYLANHSERSELRADFLRQHQASTLSSKGIDDLFGLLTLEVEEAHRQSDWFFVLNEVMNYLRVNCQDSERIAQSLLQLLEKTGTHPVVRDYAAQHLGAYLITRPDIKASRGTLTSETQQLIHEAFARAITDPALRETSVPGSALMTLTHALRGSQSDLEHWAQTAARRQLAVWMQPIIAKEEHAPSSLRISCINAAALLGLSETLPSIRQLTEGNDQSPTLIRLASISALGHLGEAADAPTLSHLSQGKNQLAATAKRALRQLARHQTFSL